MENKYGKFKSAAILLVYSQVSVRNAAKMMGVSSSTLYYYVYRILKNDNRTLYYMARKQMIENSKRWKGEQAYDLRPLD